MESSSDGNPSRESTVLPRILLLRPAITALILGVVVGFFGRHRQACKDVLR